MTEYRSYHFNEIMARREAMRKLKRQQRLDAAIAFAITLAAGTAFAVLLVLSVALISTPR
jgi:hypothetical protein